MLQVFVLHCLAQALRITESVSEGERKKGTLMKFEIPLFALLLVTSSGLLGRMAVQGIEPVLVSAAIEWWFTGVRAGARLFRKSGHMSLAD
jgi:hypothetical protein